MRTFKLISGAYKTNKVKSNDLYTVIEIKNFYGKDYKIKIDQLFNTITVNGKERKIKEGGEFLYCLKSKTLFKTDNMQSLAESLAKIKESDFKSVVFRNILTQF